MLKVNKGGGMSANAKLARGWKIAIGVAFGFLGLTILGSVLPAPPPEAVKQTSTQSASGTGHTEVLGAKTEKLKAKAPVVSKKTVTETQTIPFTSTTVSSAALPKGTSKVTTAGVNGVTTLTYEVTTTDGKQTTKKLIGQTVTTPPVMQITTIGTYVAPAPTPAPAAAPQLSCPNGTYVNSAGNTVCNPYQSNSAPAGATAQCRDGSYSFSQSRSGTCSHHGGVSTWF